MNNLKDIHNGDNTIARSISLFYQDFNEQFEGYTQPFEILNSSPNCCFIRISMNNLKDIHNLDCFVSRNLGVVLSGFQ